MKKMLFLSAFWLFSHLIFAQTDTTKTLEQQTIKERKNIIKTNVLSTFIGAFHLGYERRLTQSIGVQIGLMYYEEPYSSNTNVIQGFAITPEFRFYLKKKALEGLYLAFSPRYKYFSLVETVYDGNNGIKEITGGTSLFNFAFMVGGQKIYKNGISVEIFGGLGSNRLLKSAEKASKLYSGSSITAFNSPISLRAGLLVGFAF